MVRNVFITGASSGLGRGLALHYARAGATVHAAARRVEQLDALAAEAASGPGSVRVHRVDVADVDALVGAIRAAEEEAGGALDLVVANAGVAEATPARKADWRVVKRVLDVNVTGACVTLTAPLPAMVARGQGTVVAISSLAAFVGLPAQGAYCASKAALRTFMESLRVDLRGTGVAALSVHPGFVKTEMTAANRFPMPFLMEADAAVAAIVRGVERRDAVIAFPGPLAAMVRAAGLLPRALYEPLAARMRTF